jgi:hypothetical protein
MYPYSLQIKGESNKKKTCARYSDWWQHSLAFLMDFVDEAVLPASSSQSSGKIFDYNFSEL